MSEMTAAKAEKIIQIVIDNDAFEGDMPTDDENKIREANEAVSMLQTSYIGGLRSDACLDILRAAEVDREQFPDVYGTSAPPQQDHDREAGEQLSSSVSDDGSQVAPDAIESVFPGYDDQKAVDIKRAIMEGAASGDLTEQEFAQIIAYEEANEQRKGILDLKPEFRAPEPVTSPPVASGDDHPSASYADPDSYRAAYEGGVLGDDRIRQEALPIPPQVRYDEQPVLPVDITEISHDGLSRLSTAFASLEMRGIRLVSLEEGRAAACSHLEHDALRDETARALGAMEYDKTKATHVEAAKKEAKEQAEGADSVKVWRNRKRQHEAEARNLKALVTGYSIASARCSREQTKREKLVESRGTR